MRRAVRYVVISPVKDEEDYVEATVRAVFSQTLRPSRWVIVDDGSRDRTPLILDRYTKGLDWVTLVHLPRDGKREPGSGVVHAFAAGYKLVQEEDYDFIVKLDGDLSFAPNYFEELIAKFDEDETLGIASGIYLEDRKGEWLAVKMPSYHAAGACKVIRAKCFRDIGGFVPQRGWDTVDEIRAQVKGWKTRHYSDLKLYHLKAEGSGIGFLRTHLMDGEIHYLTGGGKIFFLLKTFHRMIYGRPFFLGGLAMSLGFLKNWVLGRPMLVDETEARFYRDLLNRRILDSNAKWLQRVLGRKQL